MVTENKFYQILDKFRKYSFSEHDKGTRFERLMQAYLLTDPKYAYLFKDVWLWNEFPARKDFGGKDTGIDLVTLTHEGDYWAVQCKCYQENTPIDKPAVDSFLSTSSKTFLNEGLQTVSFSQRLWISTTNKWGSNAEEVIHNQRPPLTRLNLYDLENAPVDWLKLEQGIYGEQSRTEKKKIRPHQQIALEKAHNHYLENDRGKMIMACGTGKTFGSLKIAESETEGKGFILFLVPSIALMGQTLTEWTADADEPIKPVCICSQPKVTQRITKSEDINLFSVEDLALPASTNIKNIVKQLNYYLSSGSKKGLTVVFSTYQSIDVIAEAQKELIRETKGAFGKFDMIICDEAHRTTGVILKDKAESHFTKVHDNNFIKSKTRLYMTATPRLYDDNAKSKADQNDAVLCSMDDPAVYGEEFYRIGFGESVERNLLTDYKVLILTLNECDIPACLQKAIASDEHEINSDDASKLIGCINALSKQIIGDDDIIKKTDPEPMKKAVAFCQNIAVSKQISSIFTSTAETYTGSLSEDKQRKMVSLSSKHIDGSMNAPARSELLSWLKSNSEDSDECKVLTNVKCLSEGVDVPSLDAVLFLSPRNSQVDVVQSVGRVMRKAEGKKYGYIIIPIVIPSDIKPEDALNDNNRYKVVWSILNALRAHDDRFNSTINKIDLNKKKPSNILVGGIGSGGEVGEGGDNESNKNLIDQMMFQFDQLQSVVFAKMVQRVGDRRYWEQWAQSVAEIASRQIDRIKHLIEENPEHRKSFDEFIEGLKKNINPAVTETEVIEMLSQHIITKPVFEALFENYSFVKNNPVSQSMQKILDLIEAGTVEQDTETLDRFYQSVRKRAEGIDNAEGKQRIIIELYDKFFKTAFPKMVEKLGIVYTPVEVVDFIIHSVNDILKKEFNRSVSDENVHVLDPFTGTGTFITRLLQSGLIEQKDLKRKYLKELHANEIVLLAYYIASVNIENAFHDLIEDKKTYLPFDGICLTDTFQLGESDNLQQVFSSMFPQNSERVLAQKKAPIKVIIGNPPYSIGQKSANDNAQNQSYEQLDNRITETYVKESTTGLNKSLYDAYIKAFRWSTDRLDTINGGIIAFITNGNWLEKPSMSGFRYYIEKEFDCVYILNLRGSIRGKSKELARKEGGNIFDILTGVSISFLIKKANDKKVNEIFYKDIGDYLSKKEKLEYLQKNTTILNPKIKIEKITPDKHHDWIDIRTDIFEKFIPTIPEKKYDNNTNSIFVLNVIGVVTNRDSWVYNYSKKELKKNLLKTYDEYNNIRLDYHKHEIKDLNKYLENKTQFVKWTVNLKNDLTKNNYLEYKKDFTYKCNHRPFNKKNLFYEKHLIERPGIFHSIFPLNNNYNQNLAIGISGEIRKNFTVLMTDRISDLEVVGRTQYLPLYHYEKNEASQPTLFEQNNEGEYIRRDGISDFILTRTQKAYGKRVTKEDIFYYVYGILHSPDYRKTFANDLKKMLPRIPLVDEPKDFWRFSKAGRQLAELHINYETVEPANDVTVSGAESGLFKVEKMRFPKKGQKETIIYNSRITIENIPEKAYEYVVNGKSAIEWIMERYRVTVDKKSGIKNDPNDWCDEVNNPRYILDLLLSIIRVSTETVDIVDSLPKMKF